MFAPAAPLNFTNAAFIRGRLMSAIEQARTPVRLVVIEASGVTDIDYTGARVLRQAVETLRAKDDTGRLWRGYPPNGPTNTPRGLGCCSCSGRSGCFAR